MSTLSKSQPVNRWQLARNANAGTQTTSETAAIHSLCFPEAGDFMCRVLCRFGSTRDTFETVKS